MAGSAIFKPVSARYLPAFSLLMIGLAIHLDWWRYSEPPFLFSDFYKAYFPAAQAVWQFGPREAFSHLEVGVGGFVNMPVLVWPFVPLLAFGQAGSAWVFLVIGLPAVIAAGWLLVRLADPATQIAPFLAFLFLINGPLVNSLREGNSTHIVLFLLVLALALWRSGWKFAAGLMLGLAALIKIPLLLFGVYFLLRGNWRIVAGGCAVIILTFLLSLLIHGSEVNIAWFDGNVLAYVGRVIPAFNVQSIDAFLMRLVTEEDGLFDWTAREPATAHKIVRTLIFVALFGAAFWLARRVTAPREPATGLTGRDYLEYCLILVLATVASPVSWSHYYLFMLLPVGLYLGNRLPLPADNMTRWLFWIGFGLTALPVVLLPFESGWLFTLAQRTILSAWLFGGILMLLALMRGLWHLGNREVRTA